MKAKKSLFYYLVLTSGFIVCFYPLLTQYARSLENGELSPKQTNIIFDLGGVLIRPKISSIIWETGPRHFAYYFATLNNPFSFRSRLFTFLENIKPLQKMDHIPCDERGGHLPQILCDWMIGHDSYEILHFINKEITKNPQCFTSSAEKQMFQATIGVMFNPEKFVKTMILTDEGMAFVRKCKKQGNKLFVLSNFNKESFELLRKQNKEFFDLFDGMIISGDIGLAKPDPAIFNCLLEKYELDPKDCIFLDDQKENLQTAEKMGIRGLHCKPKGKKYFDFIEDQVAAWQQA